MNRCGRWLGVVLVLAFFFAPPSRAGDKGGEKGDGGGKKAEKGKKELKSDASAVEFFDKAVAWQGKPASARGKLIDLQIDRMNFKLWGENEIEGRFRLYYTAPKKVRFEIWTKAWWRRYWTNGDAHYKSTGATKGRCEYLNPKNEDDSEAIELVQEALRIARLIILRNHRAGDVVFKYLELHNPKGKKDTPKCHLVKRLPRDEKDTKGLMYFYLSQEDFHPVCIAVREFLTLHGTFFIHLSKFTAFRGVQFPTRIEIYAEKEVKGYRKFLFADVVLNPDEGIKLRVNGGIDDEIYEFQKKD